MIVKAAVAKTGANAPKKAKPTPKKAKVTKKTKGGKKAKTLKFVIECKNPVEDGIMNLKSFETFLNEKVKVNGKVNQLAAGGVRFYLINS